MHREVSVIVLGLEKLYRGWEKGLSHQHRLSNPWLASRHVITRTNPTRQSHPLHWSDSATLCRGLPGSYPCRARGLPGPGLAGCEALPARVLPGRVLPGRVLPGRVLPGLRNPLIFYLLVCCLDAFPPARLAGALACRATPCRQALSSSRDYSSRSPARPAAVRLQLPVHK